MFPLLFVIQLVILGAVFFSIKEPALIQEFNLVAVFLKKGSLHLILEPSWHIETSRF